MKLCASHAANLVSTSPISVKPVFENMQVAIGRRGLGIFDPERIDEIDWRLDVRGRGRRRRDQRLADVGIGAGDEKAVTRK